MAKKKLQRICKKVVMRELCGTQRINRHRPDWVCRFYCLTDGGNHIHEVGLFNVFLFRFTVFLWCILIWRSEIWLIAKRKLFMGYRAVCFREDCDVSHGNKFNLFKNVDKPRELSLEFFGLVVRFLLPTLAFQIL